MLVADRQQAVRLFGLPGPVQILVGHPYRRMALDVVGDAGHGDTAFGVHDCLRRRPDDFRIDVRPDVTGG